MPRKEFLSHWPSGGLVVKGLNEFQGETKSNSEKLGLNGRVCYFERPFIKCLKLRQRIFHFARACKSALLDYTPVHIESEATSRFFQFYTGVPH